MRLQPLVRAKLGSLGERGAAWQAALPRLLDDLADDWDLTLGSGLPGGSASYVARATTRDGQERVVKIGVPGHPLAAEARTLEAAQGVGYAVLHAFDPRRNALLLEGLGESLDRSPRSVEDALALLADVLGDAWRLPVEIAPALGPGEDKATTLRDLVTDLWARLDGPGPVAVRDQALRYADGLAATFDVERCVVVHGDPHPANLLRVRRPRPGAEHGYVFVDPDGFRGEPEYDLGVVLREWLGLLEGADAAVVARRLARVLGERSGRDARRIWAWGFLERVSTGLYVTDFGAEEMGRRFLASAERLLPVCD